MFIYIVRHAWAYEHGDPRWPDDSLRPLEDEGAERFVKMVSALSGRGFAPQVVATSPYVRCRQTADLVATHAGDKPAVVEFDALKPGSDFEALAAWSNKQKHAESIAWVGHMPDVSWLAATLVAGGDAAIRFSKGAIAAIRVHGEVGAGCGELQWLATAKSLGV